MPGIVGVIGAGSPEENASALPQLVKCMVHESFYTSGTYVNEGVGLYVGWVCRAGSFGDCMPVWNETTDVCLILSGENFADQTETNRL
jgi:asparagine synthase (glutamine-hydrolysing)